jgi:hypothetical protein
MKTLAFKVVLTLFIAASVLTSSAQNIGAIIDKAKTAGSGIAVSTSNGKSSIVYQGKEVWSGKTTGKVTGKAKAVGDVTYAAAFDGTNVIWENIKGAAEKVK